MARTLTVLSKDTDARMLLATGFHLTRMTFFVWLLKVNVDVSVSWVGPPSGKSQIWQGSSCECSSHGTRLDEGRWAKGGVEGKRERDGEGGRRYDVYLHCAVVRGRCHDLIMEGGECHVHHRPSMSRQERHVLA